MATPSTQPVGRPSDFTPELGETICHFIADGKSLHWIQEQEGMPDRVTILRWLRREEDKFKEFCTQYRLARGDQADTLFDKGVAILDEDIPNTDKGQLDMAAVQDKKLRFEGHLKLAAQMAPKKYAPITKNEISGPGGGPLAVTNVDPKELSDEQLAAIAAAATAAPSDAGGSGAGAAGPPEGAPKL